MTATGLGPLAERVVLVTGASSGIGAATAMRLAALGATVVATARREERVIALARQIVDAGGSAIPLTLDVTDQQQISTVMDRIHAGYGRLDVLVNSAGIMQSARIAEADPNDWREMIDANLLGLMLVTQAALPLLKASKAGHVFNISSIAARLANPGSPCYAATKAAVSAFNEALRKDLAQHRIRVTAILPGLVQTEALDAIRDPATKERFAAMARSIEPLQGEDIANAIAFAYGQPPRVCVGELVIRPTDMPD